MSDGNALNQSDVEKLLAGLNNGGNADETSQSSEPDLQQNNVAGETIESNPIDQGEIERLLNKGKIGDIGHRSSAQLEESITIGQDDIENLLKGTIGASISKPGAGIGLPKGDLGMSGVSPEEGVPQGDIDYLLKRAEDALESITGVGNGNFAIPPEVIEFQFPEFGGSIPSSEHATLDQISEVELDVKIELGRANMYLEDVLKLRKGAVVALDKIAGDAVDIYVNGRLIARGEVLVMNDNFCVRVAELLAGAIPIE